MSLGSGKTMRRYRLLVCLGVVLAGCGGQALPKDPKAKYVVGVCNPKGGAGLAWRSPPDPKLCGRQWNAAILVGLTVKAAEFIAEHHGNWFRVVSPLRPGVGLTMDYLPFRIDVHLSDGRVRSVGVG
ncbi:MAG: hypothetical protein JWM60_1694 [Solirubrobacterales bacterium]|nr:hypothetical protein [Solirubrobacterales bacterium]